MGRSEEEPPQRVLLARTGVARACVLVSAGLVETNLGTSSGNEITLSAASNRRTALYSHWLPTNLHRQPIEPFRFVFASELCLLSHHISKPFRARRCFGLVQIHRIWATEESQF